jgi:hypothetical protein
MCSDNSSVDGDERLYDYFSYVADWNKQFFRFKFDFDGLLKQKGRKLQPKYVWELVETFKG